MTKAQAMAEATRRWGKRALISHNRRALLEVAKVPLRERRKVVKAELDTLSPSPETAARRGVLLREERDLTGALISTRCSVGQRMDILDAFHVMGSGDTWEQAFAQAAERYPEREPA